MRPLLQFTLDLFGAAPAVAQRPSPGRTPGVGPDSAENTARPSVEWSLNAIDTAASGAVPGASLEHLLAPQRFVHPRANRAIALGSTHVSYEFRRGKRRTIGFSIGPDGLAVRAPAWVPLHEVDAALLEKAGWIVRKLGEARERLGRVESARIEWRDGAAIPYLGEPVRLVLDPRHGFKAAGAQLHADEAGRVLLVALPHGATAPQIRDAVQAWLMRQAHRCFIERLDHFAPQLGVRWKKLSLSNAGTRWGSASADGSIRLNWRLVHFLRR